jgi:hypothetical protein
MKHNIYVCVCILLGFCILAAARLWLHRYGVVHQHDRYGKRTLVLFDRWHGVVCDATEELDTRGPVVEWRRAVAESNHRDCGNLR